MTPSISICQLLLLYYCCWVLPGHGHNMYIFFSNYFFYWPLLSKWAQRGMCLYLPISLSTRQSINKSIVWNISEFLKSSTKHQQIFLDHVLYWKFWKFRKILIVVGCWIMWFISNWEESYNLSKMTNIFTQIGQNFSLFEWK